MGVGNWFSCREARGERNGKMIRINQIKLTPDKGKEELVQKATKILRISEKEVLSLKIRKQSIDARKKPNIMYVYTVDVEVSNEQKIMRRQKGNQVTLIHETPYDFPNSGTKKMEHRPVVIGSGPAGLFCAYLLAEHGYRPVVYERGASVEERKKDVERFWNEQILNPNSNVQFGEGGEVHFHSQMTDIHVEDGKLTAITVTTDAESIRCPAEILVLAIGHSARDTFSMLYERQIPMIAKSFAVGVRVEHDQEMINCAQYGENVPYDLPAAPYKVAANLENGRGVYSFCMCPGGYVVNASSEEGRLAVNGMSYHARDGKNANSAIIVTVTPKDYGSEHPLAGVRFQQLLEERAYQVGKGAVPVQCFGDFCENKVTEHFGKIEPQIKGAYTFANVRAIFPKEIGDSIEEGIKVFDRQIHGFAKDDTVLSGVESRTSSPVRIPRNQELHLENLRIYPCGEGAGYAGGITSAAMDGIKVAEMIAKEFTFFD